MSKKRAQNGDGSIHQMDSGRWFCDISLGFVNGKRARKRIYGATLAEVREKREKEKKIAGRVEAAAHKMTVADLVDQWLENSKPALAKGSYSNYQRHSENFVKPKLGSTRLDKLQTLHVQRFLTAVSTDGQSAAMVRKIAASLSACLGWAVDMKMLERNPAVGAKLPAHQKRDVKPLESEETAAFIQAAKTDRLFALYALAIDSGCRQGELLALTWDDVDFERSTISVSKSLEEVGGDLAIKGTKNKSSTRTVTISAFTVDALQEHRKAMFTEGSYQADGPIFCGSRNKTYLRKSDIFRHSFAPILKSAGLKFRFHDLRHCCASFLIEAGEDVKTIQQRLGHSTATMTLNLYGHAFQRAQAGAASTMGKILNAAAESKRKENVA